MEGAKAGVPKPELVHKLEGCTDEVSENQSHINEVFRRYLHSPGLNQ